MYIWWTKKLYIYQLKLIHDEFPPRDTALNIEIIYYSVSLTPFSVMLLL